MNRRATARIVADTREEFAELREKLSFYIEPNADVNQVRRLLVEHAPTMVAAKTQLLLDTLLNYLMKDATEALTDAPTTVKNEFYNLDLRSCVKKSFTMEPESLEFSFDPRVIVGGVVASATVATGGLITALFLSELISRIVGGVATLVASAVAFRIAHTCRLRGRLPNRSHSHNWHCPPAVTKGHERLLGSFRATGVFVVGEH